MRGEGFFFSFFTLLFFPFLSLSLKILTWAKTRWTERAVSTRKTTREVSLWLFLSLFFLGWLL